MIAGVTPNVFGGGRVEGILITRLRHDGSKADFEKNVNFMLLNVEYAYWPSRIRIKTGTTLTWTNVGDLNHTATAMEKREWDTGDLAPGGSKAITFSEPGSYYYICTPHPWMYGQVIVEK